MTSSKEKHETRIHSDLADHPPLDQPDPEAFSSYQRSIYSAFRPPSLPTSPASWESIARSKVPSPNFGYVHGSAGQGRTFAANLAAFDRYRLRSHMLADCTRRDLSVELFGKTYASPLLVAPIGVQSIMHRDAEEATARACAEVGVPMILSSAATRSIEEVAAANGDGDRWFQLYWPKPAGDEVTASMLRRAKENGYKVLVVTLDTFALGWRPTDLDSAYLPFIWGEGCQIGHSDPVFNAKYEQQLKEDDRSPTEKLAEAWEVLKRPGSLFGALKVLRNLSNIRKSQAWLDVIFSGTYRSWSDLQLLKDNWDGPIVLKGIQTVEDAHRALDHGMAGIIVSNHGGRQLDGAMASLDALAEIMADERVRRSAASTQNPFTVLFDSGIRTGSDVLKAMALGAKAVLIGRPYMYGLAAAGEDGVKHVLRCMLAETDNALGNLGKKNLRELSRSDLKVFTGEMMAKL